VSRPMPEANDDSAQRDVPGARQTRDAGAPEPRETADMARPTEYGGRRDGLDPTRYGDWEMNGRCIDF